MQLHVRKRIPPRLESLEDRCTPATLPAGFSESLIGSASQGTQMEISPDGKLYVLEQPGTMKVFTGSGVNWTQVAPNGDFFTGNHLEIRDVGERGLLGIAFDPDYVNNHYLYVYYTHTPFPFHNRVSRFTANASGTQVVPGSELIILELDWLSTTSHGGGAIHFGPDGKLYVATGDSGYSVNSQNPNSLLGKMLRINTDPANLIPADNPFPNSLVWAMGLRNPFTFAIQPGTDRMYINDVGENTWEEVDVGVAGANYGWPIVEGPSPSNVAGMTYPLIYYHHTDPSLGRPTPGFTGYDVVGGDFYNPDNYTFPSEYANDYFFGDNVNGWIRHYDYTTNTVSDFAEGTGYATDLKVGPDGALYYLSRAFGGVYRVSYALPLLPYVVAQPSNLTVSAFRPATFSVVAGGGGTGIFTYQWQRGGQDIPGATNSTYTIPSTAMSDNTAAFQVIVGNGKGANVQSLIATLTVVPNQAPIPIITTPAMGAHFSYRNTITYSGFAIDPEDGQLNGSKFTWSVDYFTGDVAQPFVPPTAGSVSGQFTIPTVSSYTGPDVFYRIHLRVRDSDGQTSEVTRDVLPNLVNVTLTSDPAGATMLLDGQPTATPLTFTGVSGLVRSIGVSSSETIGGGAYNFAYWSDQGAATHVISTPAANSTYTATFVQRPPKVSQIIVDDGTGQRSRLRILTVAFDAIMDYNGTPAEAFSLISLDGTVGLNVGPFDNSSGQSVVTLTFAGPGLVYGSLANGLYSLTINGDQLHDSLDANLDGDDDGIAGGNYTFGFHRLFGDADGDGDVDAEDFRGFRAAFGNGSAAYDFDGDGDVDALDFGRFRAAFGTII